MRMSWSRRDQHPAVQAVPPGEIDKATIRFGGSAPGQGKLRVT